MVHTRSSFLCSNSKQVVVCYYYKHHLGPNGGHQNQDFLTLICEKLGGAHLESNER